MPQSFSFLIPSLEQTARLGKSLAQAVQACNPGALLLYGPLGAGKTTLARFLVRALPGGEAAEIASPSFTIANIYCTAPVVHHFDLYRLEPGQIDESLEESFDDASVLTLVEWPERLATWDLPLKRVDCRLLRDQNRPEAVFTAIGPAGQAFLDLLHDAVSQVKD